MESKMSVDPSGDKVWRLGNRHIHREDGPAMEYANGSKNWCQHNQLHRTDGPAIENADGTKAWWVQGSRHRTDGPAIEWADGHHSWYLHGEELTFDEWLNQNQTLTDEEKVMFKLEHG